MKALMKVAKGPGNIEVRDIPRPTLPGPDWVIIEVKAAGVCGTDLHIWHDQYPYWPPVVMGHEFSGVIAEAGDGVRGFQVGDRVVAEPHSLACGVCPLCRQGKVQICASKRSPGWGIDGAFTDYVAMPYHLLHRIPDNLSFELAALAEPMAITVHQVSERSGVGCQDNVVVVGAGPIGILAAFVAKACGAGQVIMVGVDAGEKCRFAVAKKVGADVIVNSMREDAVARVLELTGGQGADLVVETSGAGPAIASTVGMVRKCGRISAIGLNGKGTVNFPWNDAMNKVVDLAFNMSSSYTAWDPALRLMARTDPEILGSVITHKVGIGQWGETFKALEAEEGVKALFIPGL